MRNNVDLLEKWATIANTEDKYQISSFGRVVSIFHQQSHLKLKPHILKPVYDKRSKCFRCNLGYNPVKGIRIHSEVAKHFLPNPYNDKKLVFLDGNRRNCNVNNLQWFGVYWRNRTINTLQKENKPEANIILKYMSGDRNAINPILKVAHRKINAFLKYKFSTFPHYPHILSKQDIINDTFMRALSAINRGLLRTTKNIYAWFKLISYNILKNIFGKKKILEVSLTGRYTTNSRFAKEEYDKSDYLIAKAY